MTDTMAPPPGGFQVLVVEDDEQMRRFLRVTLKVNNYRVYEATTANEALMVAQSRRPDLIVLDLGLPDLDGVHVCRTLRRSLPTVPIVILTARDTEVDIVVGLDAGATDYVTKPFSTHVLLARLRAHLRDTVATDTGELVFDELRIDVPGRQIGRAHV